jgi:hypothetical protein
MLAIQGLTVLPKVGLLNEPLLLLIDASGALEEFWWENQSTGRKTCFILTLSMSDLTWTDLGLIVQVL